MLVARRNNKSEETIELLKELRKLVIELYEGKIYSYNAHFNLAHSRGIDFAADRIKELIEKYE